jgi:hypothetical protein
MAVKTIAVVDNNCTPPKDMCKMTFDKDANGRLKLRGLRPRGISQELVDTICRDVFLGIEKGDTGKLVWTA